ncbi:hypothetical protein [Aestuariivita sp.]|jgi:hypothetical protein|uniref:hypothetical protein n=1 Tax=Aestuariivita sp. TaxID=1872407 RepID=UPI00216CD100|nr:hypothetical protein [Aestuariivita sp.]MCE8007923.1 hypothetical protein [Aestuariivita sp.]
MFLRALIPAVLASTLLAPDAQAGMTAEQFEAYTTGKTLFYSVDGADYGVERYLDGRRVQWSFLDGECIDGTWYEEAGRICFAYEAWDAPQCWYFTQTPRGLKAEFADENGRMAEYLASDRGEDMVCLGPKIGT